MERVERYETLIIGGGQAGLSVGYHLKRQGTRSSSSTRASESATTWRNRWDSLRLYSPAFRDGLPGMPFPAPRNSYPTKDEMGDYLEGYATRVRASGRSGTAVDALTKENGRYVVDRGRPALRGRQRRRRHGRLQEAVHARGSRASSIPGITQLHSSAYRNLSQLQKGRCLSSARATRASDIAYETSASHDVVLSGTDTGQIPVPIESRRGRIGFRVLVVRRHARPQRQHADGPEDAPACPPRRRPAPPLPAEGPARGGSRARRRANGRRAGRPAGARRRPRP